MHIDLLCDHPEFIEELATLNFEEWGEFRPDKLSSIASSACANPSFSANPW